MAFGIQRFTLSGFKKYGLLAFRFASQFIMVPVVCAIAASDAYAQDTNCSRRQFGERCYQVFRADAGKSGSTRDPHDTGLLVRPVPEGYVVVGYEEVNESSNGGQFTLSAVARGQRSDIKRQWDSQSTRISNVEQNINAIYQGSNGYERAKLDGLKRELEELKSATNYFNSTRSNIDIFELRATSKYVCTNAFAGTCINGYGNHGKGYVKVYLAFVGTDPSFSVSRIEGEVSTLRPITPSQINPSPQPPMPAIYNTSPLMTNPFPYPCNTPYIAFNNLGGHNFISGDGSLGCYSLVSKQTNRLSFYNSQGMLILEVR